MHAFGAGRTYRVQGLTTNTHRRKPVSIPVPPVPELHQGFRENVKTFLGTSTKMVKSRYRPTTNRRRRRKMYRRKRRTVQPYTMARTFKTVTYKSLNPGAGTIATAILNLNSAFDPTGNIGAEQPLAFDQYTALYKRYAVIKWGVKMEFVSTDNSNPVVVGFTPKTDNTALTAYAHYKEAPGTVSGVITPDIDKFVLYTKGRVSPYFLPKGGKILTDDTLSALISADPSKLLYGHLWAQDIAASADPSAVNCILTIYQTVVFYDPVIPSRS